jgi:predicted ATP-dependent protease
MESSDGANGGLDAAALYARCDPAEFGFETTAELEDLRGEVVGQSRAMDAVRFGVEVGREGYNVFALGPPGAGKRALVRRLVEERAAGEPTPPDWAYVNNFERPNRPRLLRLPADTGAALRRDMEELAERLRPALSAAFESEEYQTRRQTMEEEYRERSEQALEGLRSKAVASGLALIRTPLGWAFAPVGDGQILSPEEVARLPEDERRRLESEVGRLEGELQEVLGRMPRWERERTRRLEDLNREIAEFAVGHLIGDLRDRYSEVAEAVEHLEAVRQDIVRSVGEIVGTQSGAATRSEEPPSGPVGAQGMRRYWVNAITDGVAHDGELGGAPVVYEDNPTYQNLIGRVEYVSQMGALVTDFNLIMPGALHRANGGYLVLDARSVLSQPYAWEGLKRALRSREIRIETLGQALGLVSTVSLEPEPVPLDVKVVLVGDRLLYYLLCDLDPDFGELFKVEADFDDTTLRNQENEALFARLMGTVARQENLRPLDRSGVARAIEHLSRQAGDAEKLSTHLQTVVDLLGEADYWAGRNGNGNVGAAEVQRAVDARTERSGRLPERLREETLRGTLLVDTDGEAVGQINGLSVLRLGGSSFGHPNRITARAQLGKGQVTDIEREVELGGPIHSKGVLILSGFLGGRYSADRPLSLSASLVFEQSYGGVEGDSASSAELYALLSAISGLPIRQSLAVTGSVNQHGRVQAIGGVNEKIEGFFDICDARGLTGYQGVIIPASNVKNLMLRADVVEAVAAGRFHVYPVENVDRGMEILTGVPAGERDEGGAYSEGSVNALVEGRLAEFAEQQMRFAQSVREE